MSRLRTKPKSSSRRIHATDEDWERIKSRASETGYQSVSEFIMACAASSERFARDRSRREASTLVKAIAEDHRNQLSRPVRNLDMTSVLGGEAREFGIRDLTAAMRGMSSLKWRHLGREGGGGGSR